MKGTDLTPVSLRNVRQHFKTHRQCNKGFPLPTLEAIRVLKAGNVVTVVDCIGVLWAVEIEWHKGKRFIGRVVWSRSDCTPIGMHIAFHACNIVEVL
jgi:hypothetical protein